MEASGVAILKPEEATNANEGGFTSASAELDVASLKVQLRILKMEGSTMLFVNRHKPECIEEIAIAMPRRAGKTCVSTTIVGDPPSGSQCLAEMLSKRFKRQFYVSVNVGPMEAMIRPIFERALADYISTHQHQFA